ncbi:MAG TPA: hypothetical protein VK878_23150 [Candidatus Deferrimicrobiaceae bacterium]|nr:hypothetical protein [Candidatus Deferrimicrobiaceae bacterium]
MDTLKPQDAALRALSRRYADDLDESASLSIEGAWFLELIEGLSGRQADVDRAKRFVARVDQIQVLGLLGPKLQAALESLEMTPRARSAIRIPTGGVVPAAKAGPGGEDEDDLSRQRRERISARERRP